MPQVNDKTYHWTVDREARRLDQWVTERTDLSRSQIQKLINAGKVLVNGTTVKSGYRLRLGDAISVHIPKAKPLHITAQAIPLQVMYEDADLLVVNKQKDMVVHPAPGNWDGTLVNALLYHCRDLSGIGGAIRPGIVHRLDKDTTGLMVVAKHDRSHRFLADQIKKRVAKRYYMALVHGLVQEKSSLIAKAIGRHPSERKKMAVVETGRPAVTEYTVKRWFEQYTLVECRLQTGRTHQIRVHLASIDHPVVGDALYGPKRLALGAISQVLHAHYLAFYHPSRGFMEFRAVVPSCFRDCLIRAHRGLT